MQLWAEKHITGTTHSLKITGDQKQLVSTMQYFQTSGIFRKHLQLKLSPKNIASSWPAAPGFTGTELSVSGWVIGPQCMHSVSAITSFLHSWVPDLKC